MTAKKKNRRPSQKAVIEALGNALGNVTHAAEMLGVTRPYLSARVNRDQELAEAREEGTNRLLDVARNALLDKILGGDTTAIIYALKSQGKHDGWSESPRTLVQQTNTVETVESPEDKLERWRSML